MQTKNPLLQTQMFPSFDQITPDHVKPAIEFLLNQNKSALSKLITVETPSWETLIAPMDEIEDHLTHAWSIVKHLKSVAHTDAITKVYSECLPIVSDYFTELSQNHALYEAYQKIADSKVFSTFTDAQKKVIENGLRDFKLSGVHLPDATKKLYALTVKTLSELENQFETNLLNATNAWSYYTEDPLELAGIPARTIGRAKQLAAEKKLTGWILTLDFPTYYAIITYADHRPLREKIYTAYVTRASDQGPQAGQFDNTQIINEILRLRYELAELVGFSNYAELSLATKMVKKPSEIFSFLENLIEHSQKQAKKEINALASFAKKSANIEDFSAWDVAYFSEKLKEENFLFNTEDLRPYFPENSVLEGLFTIASRLFNLTIEEEPLPSSWNPNVRFFSIASDQKKLGYFYLDLYARSNKRSGAWMDECQIRRKKLNDEIQLPVAYLVCNFNPPDSNGNSLLSHDEVMTIFHEFGHGLQHLLTTVDVAGVSGIRGIAWDAVELPSQLMEHWGWSEESLKLISRHFKTGKKLPKTLFKKMIKAKNFQSGMQLLKQIEYSLFDLQIHQAYDPENKNFVQDTLDNLRKKFSVIPTPIFNRFQNSFSHIFAGGYAAGYYSYLWAEILACDVFSKFEKEGLFNAETGGLFRNTVLALGGSKDAKEIFCEFRGREPSMDPLLKHRGILNDAKNHSEASS
jgi:oligopeptidase A